MKEEKVLNSVKKVVKPLCKLLVEFSNGIIISPQLMKFQIIWFQSLMIWETSMDLISRIHWEIKELVDHATPFLSHKLSNQDLSKDMVAKFQFFLHNIWWCAIILTKVVMVAGHSSMDSWLKTDTWYQRNVHHTKLKLREINVKITKSANQLQELNRAISLEEVMVNHLKRRWWKKFWETE